MDIIELGLPSGTKWASCNLGANEPAEYGDYFAWGDVSAKDYYIGRNCETYDLDIYRLKMDDYIDRMNVLSAEYDAAFQILGGKWHIPSGEQTQELINFCSWEWVENYNNSGVNGSLGTSKINGTHIFMPAAGYAHNTDKFMIGENGGYWTSSPNLTASNRAWSIAFDSSVINVFNHGIRYYGYSVRPVNK